jgi:hypothetical protein
MAPPVAEPPPPFKAQASQPQPLSRDLPACGRRDRDIASPNRPPRSCKPITSRKYVPLYNTIAHQILVLEDQACGVPDESFQLLDNLITEAKRTMQYSPSVDAAMRRQEAERISHGIANLLRSRGFRLHVPVDTLGDALFPNRSIPQVEYLFDCDTSSFLYMAIAEQLGASLALVEMTLPSGAGHNVVRWNIGSGEYLHWDTNGQTECVIPSGQPPYQGVGMSTQQVFGYVYSLRALAWKRRGIFARALEDNRAAITRWPTSPMGRNNLAWLIVTKKELQTPELKQEALAQALEAVRIHRMTNYLGTLACAHAAVKNFEEAKRLAAEATAMPDGDILDGAIERFARGADCTGL